MHPLIEELRELKEEIGSYQAFSDHLHISKSHVYACLTAGRPLGARFLSVIYNEYPELEALVLDYLWEKNAPART